MESDTSNEFIADAIDLDPLLAVRALVRVSVRFQNPKLLPSYTPA